MRTLRMDHSRLSRVFREIDVQQAVLQSNAEEARAVLLEAMDYLLHYQDDCHHAREDQLFKRIGLRLPQFEKDMQDLAREHAKGLLHDTQIAKDLADGSLHVLEGPYGRQLAKRLRAHVAHARAHIRREEEIFYAHAEDALETADWTELMRHASMDDPLGEPEQMRKTYPLLANRLATSVTEVAGHGDKPVHMVSNASRRVRAVAREAFEQAVEASGKLTMDAMDLARLNAQSIRQARTPLDLLLAGQQIGWRNSRFTLRCMFGPQRWMARTLAGAWRESVDRPQATATS
ncbi:MAG: hemerythrin domain-containing protein [Betaproteobacteria bacterium]